MKHLLMCATALVAFGSGLVPAVSSAQARDQLVVGATQFVTNFHPLIQVNNTKRAVINFATRPITALDASGAVVCVLCAELPTLDNGLVQYVDNADGSTGLTVTFKLLDNLTWGDGAPVTTKDVLFTYHMSKDDKIGFSNYNAWTRASDIVAVDDQTFTIHLPRVLADFNVWDHLVPEHLEGPVYAANSDLESFVRNTLYNTDPTNPGLWNGSHTLTQYEIGTQLTFETNPNWVGSTPKIPKIVLSYRENGPSLVQALLAGEIDLAGINPGGVGFTDYLEIKQRFPDRFSYPIAPGNIFERIGVNLDHPILSDVRVRQGLMHAMDRQAVVDAMFQGLQPVAHSFASPVNPYQIEDVVKYGYDPEAAKALFAEAGFTPGTDGICVNDKGDRLEFEFVTTAGNTTREQIAMVLQDQWGQACVSITPTFVPIQEYNANYQRRRGFNALALSSMNISPTASPRIVLGSDAIPSEENNWVGNNFYGYKNARVDELINEIEVAIEEDKKQALWGELQEIFAAELPFLPFMFNTNAEISPPGHNDAQPSAYDPQEIWAETWDF